MPKPPFVRLLRAKYQENKEQESRYDFAATGARVTVLPVAGTSDQPPHCGANEEIPKLFIARGKNNRRDSILLDTGSFDAALPNNREIVVV
jgi:hypothetical protein